MLKILIVDDDKTSRDILKLSLEKNYNVEVAVNGVQALGKLSENDYNVVVCDLIMDDVDGFDVLNKIKELDKDIYFILITAYGTGDIAVKSIQEGAFEYLSKPFKISTLKNILRKLENRLTIQNQSEKNYKYEKSGFIARSPIFLETLKQMARLAATDVPVLITGESGTGKEVIAQNIHIYSSRKDSPFVPVNCSAIPPTLLESELFGYEKGAFTGASTNKTGYFEQANGGTLFLDEIGELNIELQVKLLRVLQERQIRRLGGKKDIDLNIRFIFATNANLKNLVDNGKFRADLYYRLKVAEIHIPPLRERIEDIIPLAYHFLEKYIPSEDKKSYFLSKEAEKVLLKYKFPGNVRELENIIRSAVVIAKDTGVIMPDDLNIEKELKEKNITPEKIKDALAAVNGNKTKAAKLLNIGRATLYRLMEKYNLEI